MVKTLRLRLRFRSVVALALFGLLARSSLATTIRAPGDLGGLAEMSDAVVLAEALDRVVVPRGQLLYTSQQFLVREDISRSFGAGAVFEIEVPGGALGDREWRVEASPHFDEGESYLLFLSYSESRRVWRPVTLAYGVMVEQELTDAANGAVTRILAPAVGESLASDANGAPLDPLAPCYLETTVKSLRDVFESGSNFVPSDLSASDLPALGGGGGLDEDSCRFFENGFGNRTRWPNFDSDEPTQIAAAAEGGVSNQRLELIQSALDFWHGVDGASFNLQLSGATDLGIECTVEDDTDTEANVLVFDDPCDDIGPLQFCQGVLAFGGPIYGGRHSFDGSRWATISAWAVVVNDGIGCIGVSNTIVMLAHELGHGLGFGHVQDSNALMYAGCCNLVNETDSFCSRFAYPAIDASNARPVVDAGEDRSIRGESFELSGSVDDDGAFDAEWRVLTGPGEIDFDDPSDPTTSASASVSGTYLLELSANDAELFGTDLVELEIDTTPIVPEVSFLRGDPNADGAVDLSDAIRVLLYLFAGEGDIGCLASGDANDSGDVDITDAVFLLSFLFRGEGEPEAPYPECGVDPTEDELACAAQPGCA
ncbi:MAG: matrixin family metalloprotease [Planctomycetota bacterium]